MIVFSDILNILKKHGLYNGLKRIKDEFFENYLFDVVNKTSTRQILLKRDYNEAFNTATLKADLNK